MKIGLLIHSFSGNTLSVGTRLKVHLEVQGHRVHMDQIIDANENPKSDRPVTLTHIPDINYYDIIIFGAPVRAFSLSPVMTAYLKQINCIENIKVFAYVTEGLPKPWMGGNRAIRKMISLLDTKSIKILDTAVINWSSRKKEMQIDSMLNRFSERIDSL